MSKSSIDLVSRWCRSAALITIPFLLCSPSRADVLAGFEGSLTGKVSSSTNGPDTPTCDAVAATTPADRPGAYALAGAQGDVHPPEGASMLRLGRSAGGDAAVNLTRWDLHFKADEPSVIDGDFDFLPAPGAWFVMLLDGQVVACGDSTGVRIDADSSLAVADYVPTGWLSLVKIADARVDAGAHVFQVVLGQEKGSPDGAIYLDAVTLVPQVATPCRPAPYEDVGETPESTASSQTRWTFDDNKFCATGPGIACGMFGIDPRPGTGFYNNSMGEAFEMYVVADCGTQMHIPLNDVEGGCISVFHDLDPGRDPVSIHVVNGAGFDQIGGEVCWTPTNCNPGFGEPGGPGNQHIMDVSFQGAPALCGVYVVKFRSWAGCFWELFANCDGTGNEHFNIFDDICLARAAVHPLPEVIVQDLTTTDQGGCVVGYCATIRNIGCNAAVDFTVRVTDGTDEDDILVASLDPNDTTELCGSLTVPGLGTGMVSTTVTVTADALNTVLECSEATGATSCDPALGDNSASRDQDLDCAVPPVCNAGGPYAGECAAAAGGTRIRLDGSASSQVGGITFGFAWSTDCPGGIIDDPTAQSPELDITSPLCGTCEVSLTVTNVFGLSSSCTAPVTVSDTQPPQFTSASFGNCLWPPNHWYVCVSLADLGSAAFDACDGIVPVHLVGCSSDQPDDARESDPTSAWNGDGHTSDDCIVSADGLSVCVRSERAGTGPTAQDGRHYSILAAATDSCGNASTVAVATLHVPHDQSPHERGCLDPTKVGCHPDPCR